MPRGVSVTVVGADELRDVSRAIRRSSDSRALAKRFRKELTGAAKPMVPAVKSAIRRIPSQRESRRRGRKSLRAQMARSVTLQVRTSGRSAGVAVFMNPKKMPDGMKALSGYFERIPGKERLRHPVFGDRDTWVQQRVPYAGYFTYTTRPAAQQAQERLRQVVDDIAREIEDA